MEKPDYGIQKAFLQFTEYSKDLFFYEIKYKFDADIKYDVSKKQHPMIEYIKHQDSYITIFDFLDKDSNFIIKSEKVEDNILKLINFFNFFTVHLHLDYKVILSFSG